MKSPTTSRDSKSPLRKNNQGGFTLIEMIIVLALITIVGGLGLYFGLDNLKGYSFHSDRDVLVSLLQHARSEAISNICRGEDCTDGKHHGVFVRPPEHPDSYVVFQGENYINRDQDYDITIDVSNSTYVSGMTEIIFERLSGNATTIGDINLTDDRNHTSTISINSEGQILWTN